MSSMRSEGSLDGGKRQVVVLGAGVVGLSTALVLQQSGLYQVVLVSEFVVLPPNNLQEPTKVIETKNGKFKFYDQAKVPALNMATPYSGAHWRSLASNSDYFLQQCELETFGRFSELHRSGISYMGTPFVTKLRGLDYYNEAPEEKPWFFDYASNLNIKRSKTEHSDMISGVELAAEYDTFVVNIPVYLYYLYKEFISAGGQFKSAKVSSLGELEKVAFEMLDNHRDFTIINCSALGSATLTDVNDSEMYPIRGQVVIVYAPSVKRTVTRLGGKYMRYVIPRGDGTVVLGGTHIPNVTDTQEDTQITSDILKDTLKLTPELGLDASPGSDLIEELRKKVLAVKVGFRPGRHGGVRLERDTTIGSITGKSLNVVHNYGHSGFGVQSSWGYANAVYRMLIPNKL
ncbi:D-amino-acid oxidase [Smittium mucronatum]|uniref:D-amino-acid oxidase n=1 Tax=Smittium mucronatum TaxID=133383 RepID=A0A1R0H3U5_9FUNG|nr:D-amino-acid oxidase [Smittium mucronatum]